MNTVDRAALRRLQDSHECGTCGKSSHLEVRYYGGQWAVWCPRCRATEGFRRVLTPVQMWRRDPESVPWNIALIFQEKYGRGEKPLTTTELATMDEPTMIARLERARWNKDIAPADRPIIASLAVQYGLDPVMGELIVYEGKPYVTFQGWLRKIQEHPQFAGIADRPMRPDEREVYGYDAPICWIAEIYRHDWKVPAVGTGTADPGNPYRNNPAEKKFPQAFARKRAIIQAAKVGFLHSLPFAKLQTAEDAGITVDTRTGEIVAPPSVRVLMPDEVETTDAQFAAIADDTALDTDFAEDAPPAEVTPEEDARNRVIRFLAGMGKDTNGKFHAWFRTVYGCDWEAATLDQLNDCETRLQDMAKKKAS